LTRCLCCSVRTGAKVVAVLAMVLATTGVVGYSYFIAAKMPQQLTDYSRHEATFNFNHGNLREDDYRELMEINDLAKQGMTCFAAVALTISVIKALFSFLMLVGISKRKHGLMVPWLILAFAGFGLLCLIVVGLPTLRFWTGAYIAGIIELIVGVSVAYIGFYILRVVHAEYKNIKDANRNPGGDKEKLYTQNITFDNPYKVMQ